MLGLVDDVFPIERAVVLRARALVESELRINARDAIHVIMQTHGITRVMSFDRGFDRFEGLERLPG